MGASEGALGRTRIPSLRRFPRGARAHAAGRRVVGIPDAIIPALREHLAASVAPIRFAGVPRPLLAGLCGTALNCNPDCNPGRDAEAGPVLW
jgi:hypothetical protein